VSVAGLILAAGESRRMGRPKALLEYGGETFLDRLIGALGAACSPVIVVLGAAAETIRGGARRAAEARFTVNLDYAQGQVTSLQCGLRAVPPDAAGVLFTLVDHPNVRAETVTRLAEGSGLLRIPRFEGRRGHPVFVSAALFPEFLALGAEGAARDVINRHAGQIEYIDVDDAGVLEDIDRPADYLRLKGEEQA
jgi:CTP:molybdopterin cytidylyltransferase MocA